MAGDSLTANSVGAEVSSASRVCEQTEATGRAWKKRLFPLSCRTSLGLFRRSSTKTTKENSPRKAKTMVSPPPPDAAHSAALSNKKNTSQFVGFQIEGQHYAFRIEQIREIVIHDQVTPMPRVPDYVEGVSNLRGGYHSHHQPRRLLGLAQKPSDIDTRTIVVNVGERTMGCTVDAVSQVIRIPEECIQPAARPSRQTEPVTYPVSPSSADVS